MLSIMILSIVICCAVLGICMKGYFNYLTEEHNQEILKKEKEELRQKEEKERQDRLDKEEKERQDRLQKEEQERQDRLDKEEQERQDRLDKEERDWNRKVEFEAIQQNERKKMEDDGRYYNQTHLNKTLSFEELTDYLNFLISRVWSHEEHYYLKANDIVVPKIEEESIKFGGLVLSHMSPELKAQAMVYYTFDGLLYYIHGVFNDFIWKYTMERNQLQGVYQYLYSQQRGQLLKELDKRRENAKNGIFNNDDNKEKKFANFEEYFKAQEAQNENNFY